MHATITTSTAELSTTAPTTATVWTNLFKRVPKLDVVVSDRSATNYYDTLRCSRTNSFVLIVYGAITCTL